jgi:hypothetical protein
MLLMIVGTPIIVICLYVYILTQRKLPQFISFEDRGKRGEYLAFKEISGIEQGERILNNLFIPLDPNNKDNMDFTEVDLLLINSSGIYVIESKNYTGWIFGSEKDNYWTKTYYNKKYKFFRQNSGHIKAIMNALNLYDSNLIKSIIVFSNHCELKDVRWHSPNVSIVKRFELRNKIISYMTRRVFTIEDVDRIYQTLLKYTYVNQDIIGGHASYVNRAKAGNWH